MTKAPSKVVWLGTSEDTSQPIKSGRNDHHDTSNADHCCDPAIPAHLLAQEPRYGGGLGGVFQCFAHVVVIARVTGCFHAAATPSGVPPRGFQSTTKLMLNVR